MGPACLGVQRRARESRECLSCLLMSNQGALWHGQRWGSRWEDWGSGPPMLRRWWLAAPEQRAEGRDPHECDAELSLSFPW